MHGQVQFNIKQRSSILTDYALYQACHDLSQRPVYDSLYIPVNHI